MGRLNTVARAACLLAAAATPLAAQLRQTATNVNAWVSYYGDLELTDKWGLIWDASMRRSGPFDEMYAVFARGGVTYALAPSARVAAGFSRSETWPYGELPIAYRTPERRIWEQLQLSHAVGRLGITHRYRLEQRWQGRKDPPDDQVANWVRTNRFRYQLRATLPLAGKTLDPREWYLTAADEVFIAFGSNVQYNVFDQNRAAVGLGYRANRIFRFEVGYLEHLSAKSSGRQLEDNHTLTLSVFTSFSRNHSDKGRS